MTQAVHDAGGAILTATGITKSFGGVHALRGVDLTLRPQSVLAIAGENGAGKSTLIKVLLGIMPPNKGKVHFSKKLKMAYVPQKFNPSASLPLRVQDLLDLEV